MFYKNNIEKNIDWFLRILQITKKYCYHIKFHDMILHLNQIKKVELEVRGNKNIDFENEIFNLDPTYIVNLVWEDDKNRYRLELKKTN